MFKFSPLIALPYFSNWIWYIVSDRFTIQHIISFSDEYDPWCRYHLKVFWYLEKFRKGTSFVVPRSMYPIWYSSGLSWCKALLKISETFPFLAMIHFMLKTILDSSYYHGCLPRLFYTEYHILWLVLVSIVLALEIGHPV